MRITVLSPHLDARCGMMASMECSSDGCSATARRRGLCWKHYEVWLTLDPGRPKRILGDDERRFMAKVDRCDADGDCWLWTASINASGYGSFSRGRVTCLAHRASYELFVGPIPDNREIDHLCAVRHCVNPAHLEVVTRAENVQRTARRAAVANADATHCAAGHQLTADNVLQSAQGTRACRSCRRQYHTEYQRQWRGLRNG